MATKQKMTKVTVLVNEDTVDCIVNAYLNNPAKPNFGYYISEPIALKICRQVVRKCPDALKKANEYKKIQELDKMLHNNPDILEKNKMIFDKNKKGIDDIKKQGDDIHNQATKYYYKAEELRNKSVAESDELFNAEFIKAGITRYGYKNGYIQYIGDKNEKA
jgi:hypothetical protein